MEEEFKGLVEDMSDENVSDVEGFPELGVDFNLPESKAIKPYLKILPPVSPQQTLEFSQVFKLPLSRTFRTLYRRVHDSVRPGGFSVAALTEKANYAQQNVRFIDLRPKRWYRELAKLARGLDRLNEKRSKLDSNISDLANKLSAVPVDDMIGEGEKGDKAKAVFEKLDALYSQSVSEREKIEAAVAQCEAQKDRIIREIYESGYTYHLTTKNVDVRGKEEAADSKEEKVDDTYGIYIPIDSGNVGDYLPILKPADVEKNMGDPDVWVDVSGRLSKGLLVDHNTLLSKEKSARFQREMASLSSLDANLTIMARIKKYNDNIAALKDEIEKQTALINANNADAQAAEDIKNQIDVWTQRQSSLTAAINGMQADLNYKDAALRAWFRQKAKNNDNVIIVYSRNVLKRTDIGNIDAAFKALFYEANLSVPLVQNSYKKIGCYDAVVNLQAIQKSISDNQAALSEAIQKLKNLGDANVKADQAKKIIADATAAVEKCTSQLALLQQELESYQTNALPDARKQFIAEWNDPKNYNNPLTENHVDEYDDPLKDFYAEANKKFGHRNVYRFKSREGEFLTENDLSLPEFMSMGGVEKTAVLLPCVDKAGVPSSELFWGVLSPQLPTGESVPKMPVVKFVESSQLEVEWKGYALSALGEAVNLFPGEKKQIVVEKQTKLTRTVNKSTKSSQEEQRHLTSSFEENLRSELSTQVNVTNSDQQTKKTAQAQSGKEQSGSQSGTRQENESSVSASAEASFFDAVDAKAEGKDTRKNTKTTSQSQSKEAAYLLSQSNEGQTLNKTTRDVATKNLSNTVSKVSSETSSNNKLEIASSSTEQYEESVMNKESMQIENPNLGCTVNYNFYQLQNVYDLNEYLRDSKIVIDTGIMILEGVDLTVKVVCELEEFHRLFKQLPPCKEATLLCAFITRRVLKNYSDLISEPMNQGILRVKQMSDGGDDVEAISKIRSIYKRLKLVLDDLSSVQPSGGAKRMFVDDAMDKKIQILALALKELQKFSFVLDKSLLTHHSTQVVNAPAYHVDTQIGQLPAVEDYFDKRRNATLEMQSAKTELVRAKAEHTRKGKWMEFYPSTAGAGMLEGGAGEKEVPAQVRSLSGGGTSSN